LRSVVEAQGGREGGDLGFAADQDLLDELELRVPALEDAGIVDAGELDQVGDRLGAARMLGPSATMIAGRSPGTPSNQPLPVTSAPITCACGRPAQP
jgi:hypothetical protein